eukprot:TRINITY_DN2134_c0_g1_i1.p1 TRINITY_DN2134_c0_g1~~TRINITY_DN2134_c0_g1_i1.p1  ORF type:complete len:568 (+),score=139.17 TRINITY_DN2134_c0_g1_i1:150-1853(+)
MLELERRSMKMQLQSMSKRGFVLVFGCFVLLFLLSVIIGAAGPQVWTEKRLSTTGCVNNVTRFDPVTCTGVDLTQNSTFWIAGVHHIDKLNQQLTVTVNIKNKVYQKESITENINFTVTTRARANSQDWVTLTHDELANREAVCSQYYEFCDPITLATIPFIKYDAYQFNISIIHAPTDVISDIFVTFTYVQQSFTFFELWFRFVFLIDTFIILFIFIYQLRSYHWSEWLIEQRWALVLLCGLVAYNNPFFPMEILVEGWFFPFLDQVFIASFLFLLLLFWLVMIDGIRNYSPLSRRFNTFYLPKIILVGGFWLLVVIVFSWLEFTNAYDPESNSIWEVKRFVFFYVIFLLFIISYSLWLGYLFIRALTLDTKSLPYLGKRLYFFGIFTIFVILLVLCGIIFGLIGPIHNNAAELLSYLSLINLYIYVLAIVYLPTTGGIGGGGGIGMNGGDDDNPNMIGMVRLDSGGFGDSDVESVGGVRMSVDDPGVRYLEAMEASGQEDSDSEEEDLDRNRNRGGNGGGIAGKEEKHYPTTIETPSAYEEGGSSEGVIRGEEGEEVGRGSSNGI